ncbi:hypothetical protein DM02DRAFT_662652 [Periconia macrospinosa]|uniref:Uncharacterized protein n=1 Tax=Periconia macrospinosa TaxID=97972 RepID=A0A2V1D414_9PLEO|nr:hypothetical protein DM02DRAFT_662652 [Periconia macrospinosa]
MDGLPRGSLLTYLRPASYPRRSRRTSRYYQRPPPPYTLHTAGSHQLACIPEVDPENPNIADEEAQPELFSPIKSGSEYDSDSDIDDEDDEDGHPKGSCGLSEVFHFIWILLTLLIWAWSMGILTKPNATKANEMQFCLENPNREAPYPRAWRYMAAASVSAGDCNTQTISLSRAPNHDDRWRLYPEDTILIGNEKSYPAAGKEEERSGKFIEVKLNGPQRVEQGDDWAEEGLLR